MIRMAVLEHEKETKDIVFALARIFRDQDWVFRHYWKASVLAKACRSEEYQIFIFDEMFKSPRLESVFVHDNPNALFLYVCEDPEKTGKDDLRARIFYISKNNISADLEQIADQILGQARQSELYDLNYGGVHVSIPYEDIFYLEKIDKMVHFHTRKGEFHQRKNMADLETLLAGYGFIRIHVSYLVNSKHISAWYKEEVELQGGKRLPLSRSQRRKIKQMRKEQEQQGADL